MSETTKILSREEVPVEHTWALEDLYATDDAWKAEHAVIKEKIEALAAFRGSFANGSDQLLSFLQQFDEVNVLLDSYYNYAVRKSDQDTKNTTYQAFKDQANSTYIALCEATAFVEPELLSLSDDVLDGYFSTEPALATYKRFINDIRRKKDHILSQAEEQIMAAASDMMQAPGEINSILNNADMTYPDIEDANGNKIPVTDGSFISLMQNPDVNIRKAAFESLYSTYDSLKNTSAAILSAQMKQLQFNANMRHYNSALEAALDNTNVAPAVYRNLIEAVHDNMDTMYRYVRLRKKLLGVDELHMYDLYTPIVSNVETEISYEEAKENVLAACSVLGDDYVALLQEGFNNRWIDVYENVGKRSGAYSCGVRKHPYVLLNHHNNLKSEFTLAHEMGHALHSYYSNKTQPVIDSDYVIFVAEVASTCNEALLMQYLLGKTTDKMQRAFLINHFLEQFRTTLYRQTMFAEFELKMSELCQKGESINAETASKVYHDLIHLYFGDDIVHDEYIDLEWARIPHFYYNFYVYQYATGYSAAIALSQKILAEGEPAVKAYKENFLSAGCSKDPVSILKDAGVDMSTKKPIEEALKLFNSLLDEMEELMK